MIRSIDHVVIAVRDLAQASVDYERAGFTVTPGGEHAGGATHNALISFADGAYFELIAFKEPVRPQPHRWWAKLAVGEGLVDFALLVDAAAAEAARLATAGVAFVGPEEGGRTRTDGERITWRNLAPAATVTPLPFLIEDVTPRDRRVPGGAAAGHACGATGVAGLTVVVADLARAANAFAALLGAPGTASSPDRDGVGEGRRFAVGSQWVDVVEPDHAASDLRRHLESRGDGPFAVVLGGAGAGTGSSEPLPETATHGARIRLDG